MDAPIEQPATPAAPAPAPTVSASVDAATKGDFAAFRDASQAERRGTPAPEVPAAPVKTETPAAPVAETPAEAPERTISKRQQQINDYERRIAAQDQRIRDLESRMAPSEHAAPAASAAPAVPEWKRYATAPGAPKLDDANADGTPTYATMEEFIAAQNLFIAERRAAETQARTTQEQLTAAQRTRVETLTARLEAARAADPEFVSKLSPEVRALKPFDALMPGERATAATVVAEHVFDSPVVDKVLLHFSQQPDALRRLVTIPAHIASLPPAAQGKAHTQWIVKEFGRLEAQLEAASPSAVSAAPAQVSASPSPISAAPPPSPQLPKTGASGDPKDAALARGDFATMQSIFRAERVAKRTA